MIIKKFKSFIDRGKITYTCYDLGIKKFKVHRDGKVDVMGDVFLDNHRLSKIPIKFGNVSGYFGCQNNFLKTLENCPDFVGGDFNCSRNSIDTLEFLPKKIVGDFRCKSNKLKSIKELKNCNIGGDIDLRSNGITSLEGSPKKVSGDFDVAYNYIENLEHCPESISGTLQAFGNNIRYLSGLPKSVGDYIDVSNNEIFDFIGIPEETNLNCEILMEENPVFQILEIFQDELAKRDQEIRLEIPQSINEWGAIYGKKIIWDRLVEVFHDFEIEPPDHESEGFQERKKSIIESGYEIIF